MNNMMPSLPQKLDKKWIIRSVIGVVLAYYVYYNVLNRFKVNVYFNGERLDDPNSKVGPLFLWAKILSRAFISLHISRQTITTLLATGVLFYKLMMWRPSDINNNLQFVPKSSRRTSEPVVRKSDDQTKKLRIRKKVSQQPVYRQPFYNYWFHVTSLFVTEITSSSSYN